MSTQEELTGEITKVEVSYAYAKTTDKQDVYIGLSTAKISGYQGHTSLIDVFEYRDKVAITAVRQEGKNGCNLTALKVRKLKDNNSSEPLSPLSTEIISQVNAIVLSVEASFGFANADFFGTIFLPGSAFDPTVVSCINTYIRPNDQLVLKIQAQRDVGGCSWKAVEVVKQLKVNKDEECVYTSCGFVVAVTDDHVLLYDKTHGVSVTCSILTYVGGLRGNKNAKVLTDLIHDQEEIMYKAELTAEPTRQALEWKQVQEFDSLINEKVTKTTTSHTQTAPPLADMICRQALTKPEILAQFVEFLGDLPPSALPLNICQEQRRKQYGIEN